MQGRTYTATAIARQDCVLIAMDRFVCVYVGTGFCVCMYVCVCIRMCVCRTVC